MIPTIEKICEDLKAGIITVQQAIEWLYIHAEDAGAELRDAFAIAALQGILASGHQEAIEKLTVQAEGNAPKGVALAAYGFADAMLKARSV